MAVNIVALCWLLAVYVFMFFPTATPTDAAGMNWAIVMFAGIMTIATVYYFVWGHKSYVPPVSLVKREEYEYQ